MEGIVDLQAFYQGTSFDAHGMLGAHLLPGGGVAFRVFAPGAHGVEILLSHEGDPAGQAAAVPCARAYDGNFFEAAVAEARAGDRYELRIHHSPDASGATFTDHCDPFGFAMELRPAHRSIVCDLESIAARRDDGGWASRRREVLRHDCNIIIDDGSDLVHTLHTEFPEKLRHVLGGCEETTTGIIRLKAMAEKGTLAFPMILVNDADCKHLFDNRYGTGQSVWDGINRTTNLIVAGKTVVVAGYGWCGKGVAMRAKGLGAKVIVTEVDPVKAIEAVMDGFEVMRMNDAARIGDFFVTVTGCSEVITERDFNVMKDGAILCNAGHFNVEVDVEGLEKAAVEKREMRKNICGYRMSNGRWLYLLAEGRLVNLAAGDGHPAEIMDMSFAIQALSAEYLARKSGEISEKLVKVPAEIDRRVALMELEFMGKSIDTLTESQKAYLSR